MCSNIRRHDCQVWGIIMNADIHITSNEGNRYCVELTENYEGDKFHLAIFEVSPQHPNEHWDTKGFCTFDEVYTYLEALQKNF